MTRDEYWARDPAADDADRRAQVSPECEGGDHVGCQQAECDFACNCDCHGERRILWSATWNLLTGLAIARKGPR